MKIKGLVTAACAAVLLLSLTGCQLAKAGLEEGKSKDRLVGAFITDEYLDLFDMEGYLNDSLKGFSGGEIQLEAASQDYNGRLYATASTREQTSAETGERSSTTQYTFGGVQGIQFFVTETPGEGSTDGMTSCVYGEGMSDSHFGTCHGEEEDKVTLDGTLYFVPGADGQTHYINPVYQSADGRIYATTGQGISVVGIASQGGVMSQRMEESVTVTENGRSKKRTTVLNLSIETMLPPRRLVLLELDKDSTVLSRTEYAPGKLPESLTPGSATSYLILESYKLDFDGQERIERTLFAPGDESLNSFYATEQSVLVKQYTAVKWQR